MSRWRAEALERLPELRQTIASAENVMALWTELTWAFQDAYRAEPRNEALIARIYSYADWCSIAPRHADAAQDPLTAVTIAFHEEIPTCGPAREDMPRWFRYSEIAQGRQVFAYLIGDEEYEALLEYMKRNQRRYIPRPG